MKQSMSRVRCCIDNGQPKAFGEYLNQKCITIQILKMKINYAKQ